MNSDRKTFLAKLYINTCNIYDHDKAPSNSDLDLKRIPRDHGENIMNISIFGAWLLKFCLCL